MNAASLDFVELLATSAFDSILPCGDSGGGCIPQPDTTQRLSFSAIATSRMMYRVAYRRFVPPESPPKQKPSVFGACMGSSLSLKGQRFEDDEVQATQTGYESLVMNSGVAAFPTVAGVR